MSHRSLSINTKHPLGTPVSWWVTASSGHESHKLPSVGVQLGIGRLEDPYVRVSNHRPETWGAWLPGMPVSHLHLQERHQPLRTISIRGHAWL